MIDPICDRCKEELEEPGALVFGPPDAEGYVKKYHICVYCFTDIVITIATGIEKTAST